MFQRSTTTERNKEIGMSPRATIAAPVALATAVVLGLSGCSVLEEWGVLNGPGSAVEELESSEGTAEDSVDGDAADPNSTAAPVDEGLSVPTCDTIYSAGLSAQLQEELRVSEGETSAYGYGYGSTNVDLIPLLENVRSDLRISCTWYLPASESVSITSVAIVGSDVIGEVETVLRTLGAGSAETGGGTLYTIDKTTSEISPDYIATEAHFLVDVPCPASLAEESCGVWVTSNYAFGKAQPLTLDAARTLGVYSN
jgi:hypothetical protein